MFFNIGGVWLRKSLVRPLVFRKVRKDLVDRSSGSEFKTFLILILPLKNLLFYIFKLIGSLFRLGMLSKELVCVGLVIHHAGVLIGKKGQHAA